MFMINVCSAAANKILKRLSDEKDLLLSKESQSTTYTMYLNEDKEECTVSVQTLLDKFASQGVSLTIKTQTDEELELDEE